VPYYKCKRCGRIHESAKEQWQLVGATCTNCFQKDPWVLYEGPVAVAILAEEDKQDFILTNKYLALKQAKENSDRAYEDLRAKVKKQTSYTKPELAKMLNEIQLCHDVSASVHAQIKEVADELDLLGNREAVKKDAVVAHKAAASQQELFVGNRQYVSQFKSKHSGKILDVPNWSWGLNCAWVEGGISAKAHFTVKFTEDDPYTQIPKEVQKALNNQPKMSAEEFLELCEKSGKGSLLWYDKDGSNRPTWTALEMATLLRAGYRFTFNDVITLTPPM